jgi:hypothetical protein
VSFYNFSQVLANKFLRKKRLGKATERKNMERRIGERNISLCNNGAHRSLGMKETIKGKQ